MQDRLYCKLDRVLINSYWFNRFSHVEAQFLPSGTSDHSPCVVRMQNAHPTGRSMFRYCSLWSKDEQFQIIVNQAWQTPVSGTPMFRFVSKLKAVKQGLKHLTQVTICQNRGEGTAGAEPVRKSPSFLATRKNLETTTIYFTTT